MGILQAQNVHYIYQSKYQKVHAVKGINFDFEEGKFYAIVGKSGCGKTTCRPKEVSSMTERAPQSETATNTVYERFRSSARVTICFRC